MDSLTTPTAEPDSGGVSLPPPVRAGAWLRMGALLVLGVGCLVSAWLLRGSAAYALLDEGPIELGNLKSAHLSAPGARGAWVRGSGELEAQAVSFERRGENGSFVLGRLAERKDLWVLLAVPARTPEYVPPRVLEGRLLSRSALGLRLRPVLRLMEARGAGATDHLLLVGSRPAAGQTDLVLWLLLTTLGLLASVRFTVLLLPARALARK